MSEVVGKIEGSTPNKWGLLTTRKKVDTVKSELSVGWGNFYNADYQEKPCSKKIFVQKRAAIPKSYEDLPQGKKIFKTLKPVEDRRTGTKILSPPQTKEYHRPEKRHVESKWKPTASSLISPDNYSCGSPVVHFANSKTVLTATSESSSLPTPSDTNLSPDSTEHTPKYTRHIVSDEDGEPIFLKRGEEIPASKEMTRKKSVEDKRNGIKEAIPGDKAYKISEHSDGFHSGNHTKPRISSTSVSPFSPKLTKHDTIAHAKLMLPQKNAQQMQKLNSDIALVKALDSFTVPS